MLRQLKFSNLINVSKWLSLSTTTIPPQSEIVENKPRQQSLKRNSVQPLCNCDDPLMLSPCTKSTKCQYRVKQTPVFIRTYGCQMNKNDTSIIGAILKEYDYTIVDDDTKAEIVLLMTCAIRDSAESKIWVKLRELKKRKQNKDDPLKQVGILGCMAERLKEKVLQLSSGSVDIVAGPDAYRDLPRLFASNRLNNEKAINCLLSFDETYSDIRPITENTDSTAFVSITRGCDNLCSFCIVPFTRGKERSRPIGTILDEVRDIHKLGIKEVTLLGQNVNSYRDLATQPFDIGRLDLVDKIKEKAQTAGGFKTVYKPRTKGLTFDILLEETAKIGPELRVRFTSPHPKDFTDDVIKVIAKYPNICKCVHLPAQSGSNKVLERMRRGYTKEAYLDLVANLRASVKDIAITSDFISGFCGETEQDHQDTIDLIKQVDYTYIFAFAYSMRDKTHAYHTMKDDVETEVKMRRTHEVQTLFRSMADILNAKLIGTKQLILVEGSSRKSDEDFQGRIDTNIKTIIPKTKIYSDVVKQEVPIKPGDYVVCEILKAGSQTLIGRPLYITTQADYFNNQYEQKDDSLMSNICQE